MQFMGDIATKQEPGDLAHWLLAKCVQRPTMCDELLCQIIKQTTSNTNHKGASTVKGWRLLELCLGCFPCSSVMEPYLRKHVQFYSQQKGNDLYELAMRCEHKMQMIKRNGPRVHAPLYDEIKLILANKLFIRITFPDETQKAHGGVALHDRQGCRLDRLSPTRTQEHRAVRPLFREPQPQ